MHQSINMPELNTIASKLREEEYIDNQIRGEESRIVKICLIKYKCIIFVLTTLIIAFGQFIYILFANLDKDNSLNVNVNNLVKALTQHFNVDGNLTNIVTPEA
jgi:hypothetical protein